MATKKKLNFPGFVPHKTSTENNAEESGVTDTSKSDKSSPKKTGAGITQVSAEASTNVREDYERLKKEEKQFKEKQKELETEINLLKAEQDRVKKLVEAEGEFRNDIDPREIQTIKTPGRIQKLLNEKRCSDLIKDFNSHIGQKEAIYIRPIPDHVEKINDKIKYECFAGTRRNFSANFVVKEYNPNFRLKAFIKDLSDEEASVFTEKENAKEEWADVEFGFFYADLLADGTYKNQTELANKRNIDKTMVTEFLRFGILRDNYPEIIKAFDQLSDLLELKKLWVKKLLLLLEDKAKEKVILKKVESLLKEGTNLPPSVLYNSLLKVAESVNKTERLSTIKESIKNKKGKETIGSFTRSSVNNIDIKIKS